MPTIQVQRTIAAPISDVFEWLSTATNYTKSPGIFRATLAEPGDDGAFGNGAIREVRSAIGWFREVISEHHPPHAFDYLIVESRPPLLHRSGQMRFKETVGGTEVTWTSVFDVPSPVAASALGRMLAPAGRIGFASVLRAAERDLTSAAAVS
jgi:hypothetical protein